MVSAEAKVAGEKQKLTIEAEAKVDSLNELAFELKRHDVDKALSLLNDALYLAKTHHYTKGEATSYLYEAGIYRQNGYSKRALSLFTKALQISHGIKDTFNIARAKAQIASALKEANELQKAENLYKEALQAFMALEKWKDVINVRNNMGLLELQQKDYVQSEAYILQALAESNKRGYAYGVKKSYFHLGLLYLQKGELAKAKRFFTSAQQLDLKSNDKYGISLASSKLAITASREGHHEEAIRQALTALQSAKAINASQLEMEAIHTLTEVYKGQQNWVKVVEWQDSLVDKGAQLFEQERSYAINFLDILKQKQEQQLAYEKAALLASQKAKTANYLLGVVVTILVALGMIAYLWYRNYHIAKKTSKELKAKNEVIEKHSTALNALNKDITQQNQSLEEANQMKNKLLSILSHDLRGPLANTKGILELINRGALSPEKSAAVLKELEKQYMRSLSLLENLLFWIKSQMKGGSIKPEILNIRQMLSEVIYEQEIAYRNKQITVLNEVAPELEVTADDEMLKVVFRNLLSNAIKFTKAGGEIMVSSAVGEQVMVKIKDQGVGISEEALRKIRGKKYFTTNGTENEGGSGFGLMICEELIQRNGGELEVESTVGKGSLFTVKLPASSSEDHRHLAEAYTGNSNRL
ncbi:tetratricopeptide repeat-containing sensor histidine kinase [Rufibacter immobilis]|nr:ATP-binding protein [Rufibacter immobilis]